MAVEYRTVDRHGKETLDLERSVHTDGADWRNWRLVTGALPAEIARIRCDCGNGLISDDERKVREITWLKAMKKKRKAASFIKATPTPGDSHDRN